MNLLAGEIGFALADLAFVSALVAALALFAGLYSPQRAKGWQQLGFAGFGLHALSIFSVIGLLLYLIFTHQYEYHYVWSHSSNELPMRFMLASLWEGQEGSFLIWMFWHCALGLVLLLTAGRSWKPGVLGIIASVEVILSSMILGVYFSPLTVKLLYSLAVLAPAGYLLYHAFVQDAPKLRQVQWGRYATLIALGLFLLSAFVIQNLFRQQTGFLQAGVGAVGFWLETIFLIFCLGGLIFLYFRRELPFNYFVAGIALGALALVAMTVPFDSWKVGSSPFLPLRDAFPDNATLQNNPGYVPQNGNGLNPLLQNYWMVIHPPTLFLGFASTVVPFAYAVLALLKGDYKGWIKPAMPWTLFSAMILGVGIIMGGYWAYETLSFGGYWNWDPVENASLVPWLTGVGAVHAMLSWRTGKANMKLAMTLVVITFVLVLYSTFLTRSGILGNTSVHSFTDLGLSGQLLVLLFAFFGGVGLLMVDRWNKMPASKRQNRFWTRETFLYLSALILSFAAIEITLVTSLPVINKIFGTNLAPPAETQFFYYKWNVWFAIAIGILSGVGQFFFWLKREGQSLEKALFRPFAFAVIVTMAVIVALHFYEWDFGFNSTYKENLRAVQEQGSWLDIGLTYLGYAFLYIADELLLVAGIFAVAANADILIRMLRQTSKHSLRIGGSVAHMGFALMMIGILFSAGYESVKTVNINPNEESQVLPEEKRKDNVTLKRQRRQIIKDYAVTFQNTDHPKGPIDNIELISARGQELKVGFEDQQGERYYVILAAPRFLKDEYRQQVSGQQDLFPDQQARQKVDMQAVRKYVDQEYPYMRPELLNERTIYNLKFTSLHDSSESFTVTPETEVNGQDQLVSHPDRKITLTEDIYVHVSSVPKEHDYTTIVQEGLLSDQPGDTLSFGNGFDVVMDSLVALMEQPDFSAYQLKLRLHHKGETYRAGPGFVIQDNEFRALPDELEALGLRFQVKGVKPEDRQMVLQIDKANDFITIKAISKPYINFLWLGTFLLAGGFGIAIVRRIRENRGKRQS